MDKFQKIYDRLQWKKIQKLGMIMKKMYLHHMLHKLLSSLKLKTPGTSKKSILYKERQISNEDGTIMVID